MKKEKFKKEKPKENAERKIKNPDAIKRLNLLLDSMKIDLPKNMNTPEVKIPSPPEKSKKSEQPEPKTRQEKLEYV